MGRSDRLLDKMTGGISRFEWVRYIARAFEASCDAQLGVAMVMAGFDEFKRQAKPRLLEMAGLDMNDDELRMIFDAIKFRVQLMPKVAGATDAHGLPLDQYAAEQAEQQSDLVETVSATQRQPYQVFDPKRGLRRVE
jgi:hypothetical protein